MELTPQQIATNVIKIKNVVKGACVSARRQIDEVEILPVSKLHSTESIMALYDLGFRRFGENYANEVFEKHEKLHAYPDIQWVYIGQLQTNKIQRLMRVCSEIQTVASIKHIEAISRYALELDKMPFPIYLCLNAGEEAQKSGFLWHEIDSAVTYAETKKDSVKLEGIMCIPPAEISLNNNQEPPELYYKIAELAQKLQLPKLSIGMSNDLTEAIAIGSTCVRIGTAILGSR